MTNIFYLFLFSNKGYNNNEGCLNMQLGVQPICQDTSYATKKGEVSSENYY